MYNFDLVNKMLLKTMLKRFEKKNKELEDFLPIKQEIVYKVNDEIAEKEQSERSKEIFQKELISRIREYLLDLPKGSYEIPYEDILPAVKPPHKIIKIIVSNNTKRSLVDKIADKNKKSVNIWMDTDFYKTYEIHYWEINNILKFHNSLEKIILLIGKNYGYEPKPKSNDDCECEDEDEIKTPLIP